MMPEKLRLQNISCGEILDLIVQFPPYLCANISGWMSESNVVFEALSKKELVHDAPVDRCHVGTIENAKYAAPIDLIQRAVYALEVPAFAILLLVAINIRGANSRFGNCARTLV